jgi:hypothetical protein
MGAEALSIGKKMFRPTISSVFDPHVERISNPCFRDSVPHRFPGERGFPMRASRSVTIESGKELRQYSKEGVCSPGEAQLRLPFQFRLLIAIGRVIQTVNAKMIVNVIRLNLVFLMNGLNLSFS